MRTISIQADGEHLDQIMEEWLAHLVQAIPVGPHGIKFDGDLSNGTIVNHRSQDRWTVSFRPNPDGRRRRAYSDPYVVARVIITREHQADADLSGLRLDNIVGDRPGITAEEYDTAGRRSARP
jgi:hypothetical protein